MRFPRLESDLSTAQEVQYLAAGAGTYMFIIAGTASFLTLSWGPLIFGVLSYAVWTALLLVWSGTVEPLLSRSAPAERMRSELPARPRSGPMINDDVGELETLIRRLQDADLDDQSRAG